MTEIMTVKIFEVFLVTLRSYGPKSMSNYACILDCYNAMHSESVRPYGNIFLTLKKDGTILRLNIGTLLFHVS